MAEAEAEAHPRAGPAPSPAAASAAAILVRRQSPTQPVPDASRTRATRQWKAAYPRGHWRPREAGFQPASPRDGLLVGGAARSSSSSSRGARATLKTWLAPGRATKGRGGRPLGAPSGRDAPPRPRRGRSRARRGRTGRHWQLAGYLRRRAGGGSSADGRLAEGGSQRAQPGTRSRGQQRPPPDTTPSSAAAATAAAAAAASALVARKEGMQRPAAAAAAAPPPGGASRPKPRSAAAAAASCPALKKRPLPVAPPSCISRRRRRLQLLLLLLLLLHLPPASPQPISSSAQSRRSPRLLPAARKPSARHHPAAWFPKRLKMEMLPDDSGPIGRWFRLHRLPTRGLDHQQPSSGASGLASWAVVPRQKRHAAAARFHPVQLMRVGCALGTCQVQNLSHRLWQLKGQSGRQDSSPMNPSSPHSYG
ncbi:protein ADM2 [Hemicordylus capensis]|uniref:protein ADM2 n=1 Tax=Hemicordylus capensis TaxID=884348 RepID=UPI0023045E78|nr:protein ADM2 [Hemicordylus capensis]